MTRVAVVQNDPLFGQRSRNIADALALMDASPADVYVLPELFASGYNFTETSEVAALAEPFGSGETFDAMQSFARRHHAVVVYGFPERSGDRLYNAAGLITPDGSSGLYRKIHLFDREKLFFTAGDLPFKVWDTPFGRIGVMVCFDWYFPESARTLTLRGAQLIAHPSNLVLPHCPDSMTVRCRENRVFAATANRVGSEDRGGVKLTYIGQSQITGARGEILLRASFDRAEIRMCELDLNLADDKRLAGHNDLIGDRRPEFYA
jgi:5-aminopentanamidase